MGRTDKPSPDMAPADGDLAEQGGPVGAVAAGTAGAVAGALGSAPAARLLNPKD